MSASLRFCLKVTVGSVFFLYGILFTAETAIARDSLKSMRLDSEIPAEYFGNKDASFRMLGPSGQPADATEVVLRGFRYQCTFSSDIPEGTWEWSGTVFCYEVSPREQGRAYSYAVSSFDPLVEIKLFSQGPGRNFLAWVDGGLVLIEEISKLKNRSAAVEELMSRKWTRYAVPVTRLAGREDFIGEMAIHHDIKILDVRQEEDATMRVKVKGGWTGKVFEFLYDAKEWHLSE